jgi:NAD(P)-dependent dehydrogenase (short-subunit alcohol dehydrogenase family)
MDVTNALVVMKSCPVRPAHVAKRFARGGFHACLARRSDGQGPDRLVREITDAGGSASGFMLNAVEDGSIETLVENIESDIGPIEVAVDNLNAQIGDCALAETSLKAFETGWRMAAFGLFRLASCLLPRMAQRGHGTLVVTAATASMRGNGGQHSHAAALGGRRLLSQTLNAEFAAKRSRPHRLHQMKKPPQGWLFHLIGGGGDNHLTIQISRLQC